MSAGVVAGFGNGIQGSCSYYLANMRRYHDAVEAGLRALAVDAQDVADCQTTVASEHDMDLLVYAANMAGQVSLHPSSLTLLLTPCLFPPVRVATLPVLLM